MRDESIGSVPVAMSARLKTDTAAIHERLDAAIMAASPFADRARFARFQRVQLRLYHATAGCYEHARICAWLPSIAGQDRLQQALSDCADLGVEAAEIAADRAAGQAVRLTDPYRMLGWVYTREGSTLGAAILLKMARERLGLSETFGARHLAAHEAGRAAHWRDVRAQLDAVALSGAQREQLIAGAKAAFAFVHDAVRQLLPAAATERV